jgi:hypothetical protein
VIKLSAPATTGRVALETGLRVAKETGIDNLDIDNATTTTPAIGSPIDVRVSA